MVKKEMHARGLAVLFMVLVVGCSTSSSPLPSSSKATPPTAAAGPSNATVVEPATEEALPPVTATYPWRPSSTARLDARFKTPAGFKRVDNEAGSFGAFLRTLPLQPEGSKVVDYRGEPLYSAGHHPNIVAVADIDIGNRDLQHCADVIIRLHAEWRFGKGERDISYRALSGHTLSYRGYASGDRAIPEGNKISIQRTAGAHNADDHAFFRGWLNDVFSYAGTASLERDAAKISSFSDVHPGDFFVKSGSPFGHAVLILDMAKDDRGRTALLLGQSFMPAQSFEILKPTSDAGGVWFIVEPGDSSVDTPFWPAFPMSALHRFG